MGKQLHKSFRDQQVRSFLQSYINKEIELSYILDILKIGRSRFFALLKAYRHNPTEFSIAYKRSRRTRSICPAIEKNVLSELAREKQLIESPDVPLHSYNYSYIRDLLWRKHRQKVSVATIIRRAKQHDFYLRRPKRKAHDREVLTNYIGELIQHDSSYHRWSPYAPEKWHLITSLDDFSRKLLYAELVERETSWDHISALEAVVLSNGVPYAYYTDSHSVFRFVQGRRMARDIAILLKLHNVEFIQKPDGSMALSGHPDAAEEVQRILKQKFLAQKRNKTISYIVLAAAVLLYTFYLLR